MLSRRSNQLFFWLLVALLLVSVASLRTIPFWPTWALDLQNLFQFHHCAGRNNPYLMTGRACGDPSARDMFYPPLLYWSFVWVRLFSFKVATKIWCTAIVLVMVPLARIWTDERVGWRAWVFWILLVAQFPVGFAVERGNSDVLVVLVWSLALALRGRPFWCGALMGVAVLLKLYPLLAVVVVVVGVLGEAFRGRSVRALWQIGAGGLVAAALGVALCWRQTLTYLHDQLPRFSNFHAYLTPYGHPMPALTAPDRAPATALSAILVVTWCVAALRRWRRDPVLIFAGGLAISTYFAVTSFDYNLITVYPLLLVLFLRTGWKPALLLLLGLVAVVGDRGLFATVPLMKLHIALQVAWLFLAGLWAAAAESSS
jgi:hypothetical protein